MYMRMQNASLPVSLVNRPPVPLLAQPAMIHPLRNLYLCNLSILLLRLVAVLTVLLQAVSLNLEQGPKVVELAPNTCARHVVYKQRLQLGKTRLTEVHAGRINRTP